MTDEQILQLGLKFAGIETELKNFNQSFSEFKQGIGRRTEELEKHNARHCLEITTMMVHVSNLKMGVYGVIGLIMSGVIGALLKMVLTK